MDAERAQYARTIGARVRRIRKVRKKTLEVIAGLAGMSKSKLDRIERGELALDKLSDIIGLAGALEVSPGDLVRLSLPAPANGHTDSTIRAVRRALNAVEGEEPNGLVLPVAVLREQVAGMHTRLLACRFGEVATELPGLIRNLHTTLATGADHAELLDLAVYLHVHVTRMWLIRAGAATDLKHRTVFLARRLARERDEVTTLAMAGLNVAESLLYDGDLDESQAILDSITLPPTTPETAGLVGYLTVIRAKAAPLLGRPEDGAAPLQAAAELAERFGATGRLDSRGFLYSPTSAAINGMWFALEQDNPDQAVRIARQTDPRQAPFSVNRAYLWINYGCALSKLPGHQDDAVRALRTAEHIFRTATLRNQAVREVLSELSAGGLVRTMGLELRGMAYRAGLTETA